MGFINQPYNYGAPRLSRTWCRNRCISGHTRTRTIVGDIGGFKMFQICVVFNDGNGRVSNDESIFQGGWSDQQVTADCRCLALGISLAIYPYISHSKMNKCWQGINKLYTKLYTPGRQLETMKFAMILAMIGNDAWENCWDNYLDYIIGTSMITVMMDVPHTLRQVTGSYGLQIKSPFRWSTKHLVSFSFTIHSNAGQWHSLRYRLETQKKIGTLRNQINDWSHHQSARTTLW